MVWPGVAALTQPPITQQQPHLTMLQNDQAIGAARAPMRIARRQNLCRPGREGGGGCVEKAKGFVVIAHQRTTTLAGRQVKHCDLERFRTNPD